jgi:hypothetical protein
MNHWPFIIAAYGITFAGTILVSWFSWSAARKAEARADAMTRDS